jgi:glycosyltransferase involved in cell wall biosynthesis
MNIRFLSKGSPEQISGGYLYNKYVLEYLRHAGVSVTYHPDPTGADDLGAADFVVVDSIAMGERAARLLSLSAELILLLHVVPDLARSPAGADVLKALCRRSRLVVTGDQTLAALRGLVADSGLDAVKVEPGIRDDWRAKAAYASRAQTLLGVANYIPGKGIVRLLDVLRELRHLPWTMTLHGNRDLDPAYFAAVGEKLERHGLSDRVELLGAVPHEAINRKMLQSDLLVHFSQRESYSMVTAEAIASGLPVLAYRTGNFGTFGRSGLVRYIDGEHSAEAAVLGALIEDERAYGQLRPAAAPPTRTWQDVGREFLECLEPR